MRRGMTRVLVRRPGARRRRGEQARWPIRGAEGSKARVVAQLDGTTTAAIGCAGAVLLLVSLLEAGGVRGKKGAATALYGGARENRQHAVEAGVTAGSRTRGEAVSRVLGLIP